MKSSHTAARVLAGCALVCATGAVHAQPAYPAKPITFLIPFPPASGNDVVGRIVANKLSESIGQRVVADNRAGASGTIAIEATRRAAPDGYTLAVASTSFSINLYTTKVNYKLSDFTPVAMLGSQPFTLMVVKSIPAKNMKELVDTLKAKPNHYNVSAGVSGMGFFLPETFKKLAGVDVQLVSYKGTTDGIVDLLAERTHMMFAPMSTSLPQYRAGKVNMIGVTGSKRSSLTPNVSTFTEQGYPYLDIPAWFALLGPAGMPANAVKVVSDATAKALASKDVIDALLKQGVEPGYASAAELDAFLKADTARWGKLVKELDVKVQ